MTDEERENFEEILRNLTLERKSVTDAMIFCLDHSESSAEMAFILLQSFAVTDVPMAKKVARLYLMNDILYNSSTQAVPSWSFRKYFEAILPEVFEYLNISFLSDSEVDKKDAAKDRVMKVV